MPAEISALGVWLHHAYTLSLRDVAMVQTKLMFIGSDEAMLS
jgi:transposase-like protein